MSLNNELTNFVFLTAAKNDLKGTMPTELGWLLLTCKNKPFNGPYRLDFKVGIEGVKKNMTQLTLHLFLVKVCEKASMCECPTFAL